jgi:hypothetical protein
VRADPTAFALQNQAAAKSPRFVVKIEFSGSSLYLSSHDDITGVPTTHLEACLIEPSISSQKLNPDQGRAEIGAASFMVADRSGAFTAQIRDLLTAGQGLRSRTCRFYLGYQGLEWADFVLVGTQIVKEASYDKGAYRITCNDIQRSTRKDIFDLVTTTIASTVEAADTTIYVNSTAGFAKLKHGTSYTDAASSTVGYLKIKDEVIRYTGSTSTSFTGCTRGVLGTAAARYVADGATPAARREKVSEYVYLELPGAKLAYAILTGELYGDSATLPTGWHLGISTSLVKTADFTGLGKDQWDTTDDAAGVVLRFEGLGKTDGKAFIETEILRLLGLYMPVYSDGTLGLRRMTRVLADASGVVTLDESNSVTVGDLEHDMESLHNAFAVHWNFNGKDFTRTTTYLDADSAGVHGRASTMDLKFKGLFGGRHTDGLIFKLLDSIRDRYSAPPCRLRVDVLHSLNRIEVGDVVRVNHRCLRDYAGAEEIIDRAFEVQSVSVNHRTGAVALNLFGSTSQAAVDTPTTSTTALPDGFYTALGTNLTSVMTIASGVVSGGPYTLNGTTDLTASGSVWYYDGDLTIPESVTINITGNVQLRVKGYLTLNGKILGTGGGLAGVADNSSATTLLTGNAGWVGNSRGQEGCNVTKCTFEKTGYGSMAPLVTGAKHASFPYLALEVSGTTLKGLPTDLRGTGGGPGGKVVRSDVSIFSWSRTFWKSGGTGAAGGAGLCTVSRGFGLGANAQITLNGLSTTAPTAHEVTKEDGSRSKLIKLYPGAGGAGGPGSYLCLIDGGLLSVPDLAGRFVARTGTVGLPSYNQALTGTAVEVFKSGTGPFVGYVEEPSVISALDLSYSCQRIQYVPAPETATNDSDTLPPPADVDITNGTSGYSVTLTPATGTPPDTIFEVWEHTAATPFSSAVKRVEGAATGFFLPRPNTTTVYVWVRARRRTSTGATIYSTTTPSTTGLPAAAAAVSGTYAVVTPSSVSKSAASSSMTTSSVTASLVGGTGSTYSWVRQSGSTAISVDSASAATTTFSATGVAAGATVEAVFRVTVNSTYTFDVTVSCSNTTSTLGITASPTSVSKTEDASTITTATVTASATGGAGGYSYAWTKVSGGSISAVSASSAATTFQATGMTDGEVRSATMRCTATDSATATATVDVTVTITRQGMVVTLSPTSLFKTGTKSSITTGTTTATPSGGTEPYTYAWTLQSGSGITAAAPSWAATQFNAAGMAIEEERTATFRVTATDSTSPTPLTATRDIDITIIRTA